VTTAQEHHAVLLPFYGRCDVRLIDVGRDGRIDLDRLLARVDAQTKLVALAHASNVTGAFVDVAALAAELKKRGVRLLVDAAQSAPHVPLSVAALGADFVALSAHKMYGPTGVGVLLGKRDALESLSPAIRGGGAVLEVTRTSMAPRPLPRRLEPGTPPIAAVIGFGAALDALTQLGPHAISEHAAQVAAALVDEVERTPGAALLGPARGGARVPLASIVFPNAPHLSPDDVARALSDAHGVCVRAGHLCCHPYFDGIQCAGALRASAGIYTSLDDVAAFGNALRDTLRGLGVS